ncbi:phospholipase D-like domain-containing protein [Paraburkholderia sp. SARCC-3016]|uniref:phospholipase D-like domain-containing protein n=1 Tax=Paraburkholderia sp. SARCC-3016 TaxID=3058611 RepID=UPI002809D86F|nr:phospholipase D-like domain-containing protein [Paraburkholderia sp. SARCC-3016]MDQ7979898.1 phospholipase D-like domain-containing protein [Paraburkholderia sp. SARCC-3016]
MSTFIWNRTKSGNDGHLAAIKKNLSVAQFISICSGHLKHNGVKAIAKELRQAIARGSRVVFYSNDMHTQQEAADELAALGAEHIVVDNEKTYLHTKLYYFEVGDRYAAIVGSANITKGALTSNEEFSYAPTGVKGDPQHQQIAAYLEHLDSTCRRCEAKRIDDNGNPIPLVYR